MCNNNLERFDETPYYAMVDILHGMDMNGQTINNQMVDYSTTQFYEFINSTEVLITKLKFDSSIRSGTTGFTPISGELINSTALMVFYPMDLLNSIDVMRFYPDLVTLQTIDPLNKASGLHAISMNAFANNVFDCNIVVNGFEIQVLNVAKVLRNSGIDLVSLISSRLIIEYKIPKPNCFV